MNDQQLRTYQTGIEDGRANYAPRPQICDDPAMRRYYLSGYQQGRRERRALPQVPLFDEPGYEESRRPFYS